MKGSLSISDMLEHNPLNIDIKNKYSFLRGTGANGVEQRRIRHATSLYPQNATLAFWSPSTCHHTVYPFQGEYEIITR